MPEQLKVGDNILVRDHTSKAFQPKYKDFCIIGLLGKKQVEIKDNHSHTTKVHCRDIKKIPISEKVCQLYEEEQIGKVRQGRKAIPDNKMPDLGWDTTEELNIQDTLNTTTKDTEETARTVQVLPETITAIVILITTFLETLRPRLQEILQIGKNTAQAILITTRTMSRNRFRKRKKKPSTNNYWKTYRQSRQIVPAILHSHPRDNDSQKANHNKYSRKTLRKDRTRYGNTQTTKLEIML